MGEKESDRGIGLLSDAKSRARAAVLDKNLHMGPPSLRPQNHSEIHTSKQSAFGTYNVFRVETYLKWTSGLRARKERNIYTLCQSYKLSWVYCKRLIQEENTAVTSVQQQQQQQLCVRFLCLCSTWKSFIQVSTSTRAAIYVCQS